MGELVTIKAKPGSRKFASTGSMQTVYTENDKDGNQISEKKTEFISERFPKSKQMFRVPWSHLKRKWLLDGFPENCNDLNDIVEKCKLQYEKPHKNAGDYIVKADIYDYNDKFFNHRLFKITASEGEVLIDKSFPLQDLVLRGLKLHPLFQVAGEDNPLMNAGSRYVIVDRAIDVKIKRQVRDNKLKVMKLYESLTGEKKIKIAMAMNLIPNENVDIDVVEDVLFKASEDLTKLPDINMSRQDLFITFCELKTEDLNLKHRIAKAKSTGVLKKQADGWILFGSPVGKTNAQLEDYLSNPDNSKLLLRLDDVLNGKSSKTPGGVQETS
jgi:hypothetical protein